MKREGVRSVSFDRAVDYYDQTRALPEQVMADVVGVLATELRVRDRCLEVGVGTGRMALPVLRTAALPMVGLDLSSRMLARLVVKAGGVRPFPLVVGDATRLPFTSGSFGAALAVHVLHLIPDWPAALAEMVRTVRSGGVILVNVGGFGSGWWSDMQRRFSQEVGLSEQFLGTHRAPDVDAAMAELGSNGRSLPVVRGEEIATPNERIGRLEAGLYSFTWRVDDEIRRQGARAVRRWAAETLGDLDEPRAVPIEVAFRAYDVPAG